MKRIIIRGAHPAAELTRLEWLNDTTLLTAGRDACFRVWNITHHE